MGDRGSVRFATQCTTRLGPKLQGECSRAVEGREGRMEILGTFGDETRKWQQEVDKEAAKLVRQGVSPSDALIQAEENVRQRRRSATN